MYLQHLGHDDQGSEDNEGGGEHQPKVDREVQWTECLGDGSRHNLRENIYLIIYLLSLTCVTRDTYRVDARVGHVDEEDGEGPEHPHRHAVLLLY